MSVIGYAGYRMGVKMKIGKLKYFVLGTLVLEVGYKYGERTYA